MCGINGVSSFDVNLVTKMNEASRSRGPDASNLWYDNNVTFEHNLLNLVVLLMITRYINCAGISTVW